MNSLFLPEHLIEPAPAWDVSEWFNHGGLSLEELRGKVVVLHAFQMLCPGCVSHGIPQAQKIQHTFSPDDVAVIGIHTVFEHHDAMTPTSLKAFLHEYKVTFPVAVDAHTEGIATPNTMKRYNLRGTPSLVLIDREGFLRSNIFGRPDDMAIGAAITLLAAGPLSVPSESRTTEQTSPGCSTEGCQV